MSKRASVMARARARVQNLRFGRSVCVRGTDAGRRLPDTGGNVGAMRINVVSTAQTPPLLTFAPTLRPLVLAFVSDAARSPVPVFGNLVGAHARARTPDGRNRPALSDV